MFLLTFYPSYSYSAVFLTIRKPRKQFDSRMHGNSQLRCCSPRHSQSKFLHFFDRAPRLATQQSGSGHVVPCGQDGLARAAGFNLRGEFIIMGGAGLGARWASPWSGPGLDVAGSEPDWRAILARGRHRCSIEKRSLPSGRGLPLWQDISYLWV